MSTHNSEKVRLYCPDQRQHLYFHFTSQESFDLLSSHAWALVTDKKMLSYATRIRNTLEKKGREVHIIKPTSEIPEGVECVVFLFDPYPHGQRVAQQVNTIAMTVFLNACVAIGYSKSCDPDLH